MENAPFAFSTTPSNGYYDENRNWHEVQSYQVSSVITDIPCCVDLNSMFSDGPIVTFKGDLGFLEEGKGLFWYCDYLTSFEGNLSSLTNGFSMFEGCRNLTSFTPWCKDENNNPKNTGVAGNLKNGLHMFEACKLDLASVKRIADWLPTRMSGKPTGSEWDNHGEGWIHIGVAEGVNSGDDYAAAIQEMTDKNWRVVICVNGEWNCNTVN